MYIMFNQKKHFINVLIYKVIFDKIVLETENCSKAERQHSIEEHAQGWKAATPDF